LKKDNLNDAIKFLLEQVPFFALIGPYYKNKLELKLNLSKILPSNCKFIYVHCLYFLW